MSKTVALSGYTGAGKSSLATYFEDSGFAVLDADKRAKEVINSSSEIKQTLKKIYGDHIIGVDEMVNFTVLAPVVFQSLTSIRQYNEVVHPAVHRYILDYIQSAKENVVIDGALLPLWNMEQHFDICLWIEAPREVRLQRLILRTGLNQEELIERMNTQELLMDKPSVKDWVYIDNYDTMAETITMLDTLLKHHETVYKQKQKI